MKLTKQDTYCGWGWGDTKLTIAIAITIAITITILTTAQPNICLKFVLRQVSKPFDEVGTYLFTYYIPKLNS